MKDYRGLEIEIGAQVAFNWSGEVRLGVVVGFGKRVRERYVGGGKYAMVYDILIQGEGREKVSKVRFPSSLVVLTPPNETGYALDV